MVYITSWDEFVERSVQLFRADPDSTRYVMKYRHCDGKLVLKVTDNREKGLSTDSLLTRLESTLFPRLTDVAEVTGKEQIDAQPTKKGRGRKQ
ncbi:signal recognition particle 9 kda protein [Quercus suber]|uniref:Signal recognition particle 9 kDa protein n=1 Tax=Quercus suber TaxID=58331 RepID=A0AAW0KTI6_QUESU